MEVELFSWGGAGEVTGSKHFIRINGQLIQIDCGAFQGRRSEALVPLGRVCRVNPAVARQIQDPDLRRAVQDLTRARRRGSGR